MDVVQYEENGSVALITFNREEKLNAMNTDIVQTLINLFSEIDRNEHIKAAILTGQGRAFVAGADIGEYSNQNFFEFNEYQSLGRKMYEAIEFNRKPFIAAVNGYALGGGFELVLACDFVIASTKAKMGLPEIQLGLIPGGGGTQKLTKIVGRNRAKELLMTGRRITATEGLEFGIVNRVVEPELLLREAFKLARELTEKAPLAIREIKRLVNQGLNTPIETALSLEQSVLCNLFQTEDAREGISAFVEKRNPVFKGK